MSYDLYQIFLIFQSFVAKETINKKNHRKMIEKRYSEERSRKEKAIRFSKPGFFLIRYSPAYGRGLSCTVDARYSGPHWGFQFQIAVRILRLLGAPRAGGSLVEREIHPTGELFFRYSDADINRTEEERAARQYRFTLKLREAGSERNLDGITSMLVLPWRINFGDIYDSGIALSTIRRRTPIFHL